MKKSEGYGNNKNAIVKLFVKNHKGENLHEARVFLLSVKNNKMIDLIFDKKVNAYQASDIPYGKYLIKIECKGLLPDQRSVHINSRISEEYFILGEADMLVYYNGKVKIPFKPLNDILGISVKPQITIKEEKELKGFLRKLGGQIEEVVDGIQNDIVRAVRLPSELNKFEKQKIHLELEKHALVRLVGPVVHFDEFRITFLTNKLIVCFYPHVTKEEVYSLVKKHKLGMIQKIEYAKNVFLLKSGYLASYSILQIAEELVKNEIVKYAEPNFVTTVVDF